MPKLPTLPKLPKFDKVLALFKRVTRFSWPFFWQVSFVVLLILCALLAGVIWFSGGRETHQAFEAGRRVVITLETGAIEGHAFVTPPPALPPVSELPPAPPAPAPEAQMPVIEPPTTLPADQAQAPEQPAQPLPSPADIAASTPSANAPPDANPALAETSKSGMIPIIGKDGTKPWVYYAKPFKRDGNQPMIAIIITGLGENKAATAEAAHLPENISLSFSPYAPELLNWVTSARITGHEILLDLPLQPANYPATDPGPYALLLNRSPEETKAHLEWLMTRLPSYVGFLTPQNEAYSANADAFKQLLQTLSDHGLMIVIGRQPAQSATRDIIDSTNTANVVADTLIDEDLTPTAIQARMTLLEDLAKKRGYAVGIAQPLPLTLDQLRQWSKTLAERGILLVPVSAIAHLRFS